MSTRERLQNELQVLNDSEVEAVYEVVQKLLEARIEPKRSLAERLQSVRFVGPPDLAENHELYASGKKTS